MSNLGEKQSYYAANKERVRAVQRIYLDANRDAVRAAQRERARRRYWRDPEAARARVNQYFKDCPEVNAALAARRRVARDRATPAWADLARIREVYAFAVECREAGLDVHVDHIFPLKGKTVSGLHVAGNLRVCLAEVNLKKGNRFDPQTF